MGSKRQILTTRRRRGPSLRDKAVALAREKGTVRTKDLEAIGVPRHYPYFMCNEGRLEKVRYGVYWAVERGPSDPEGD